MFARRVDGFQKSLSCSRYDRRDLPRAEVVGAAPRGSLRMSRATRRPITLDDIPRLTEASVVVVQRRNPPYPLGVKSDTEGVKVGVESDTESVKVVQYKSSTKSVKV